MSDYEVIKPQEVMIRLLGKLAFSPDEVKEIVVGKRHKKPQWIRAYNLCDGEHQHQKEIAQEAGIDRSDFSKAIREWEQLGILFYVKSEGGDKCPKAITFISEEE